MMIGRDESMPNVVRESDLSSDERDLALEAAGELLRDVAGRPPGAAAGVSTATAVLLARAVLRYCPGGVPLATPVFVARAADRTMPACGAILGAIDATGTVAGELEDTSSGIPEPSGDDIRTSQVNFGQTGVFDITGVDLAQLDLSTLERTRR